MPLYHVKMLNLLKLFLQDFVLSVGYSSFARRLTDGKRRIQIKRLLIQMNVNSTGS